MEFGPAHNFCGRTPLVGSSEMWMDAGSIRSFENQDCALNAVSQGKNKNSSATTSKIPPVNVRAIAVLRNLYCRSMMMTPASTNVANNNEYQIHSKPRQSDTCETIQNGDNGNNTRINAAKTSCTRLVVIVARTTTGSTKTLVNKTWLQTTPDRLSKTGKPFLVRIIMSATIIGRFTKTRMNKAFAASRLFQEYGRVTQNKRSPGSGSA